MIKRLAFAIFLLCILGACGNKGPLVLPQKPQPVVTDLPVLPATEPAETVPADPVPPAEPKEAGDGTPR